ncbi:tRNA-splicing endonuclease subunit Sen15 isoform X1 [Pogona vitticeps]
MTCKSFNRLCLAINPFAGFSLTTFFLGKERYVSCFLGVSAKRFWENTSSRIIGTNCLAFCYVRYNSSYVAFTFIAYISVFQFTKMMSLDVADSSSVYAAFLVYLDLLEVRNWYEVSFFGLAEFQLVGLRGREREAEDFQVVMPTPVHVSFSHERLRQIMKRACALENNPDSSLSLTLAIVESDSTIVYYKLTDGFVMPNPPEDTKEMDDKQWKKKKRKKAWRH